MRAERSRWRDAFESLHHLPEFFRWLRRTLAPRDFVVLVPVALYFLVMGASQVGAGLYINALISAGWMVLLAALVVWLAHRRRRKRAQP